MACEHFPVNLHSLICNGVISSFRMVVLPAKSVEGLLSNVLLKSRRAVKRSHSAIVRKCTTCTVGVADLALSGNKNANVFSCKSTVHYSIVKKMSSRESWCSGDLRIFLVRLHTKIPWACIFAAQKKVFFAHIGHRP